MQVNETSPKYVDAVCAVLFYEKKSDCFFANSAVPPEDVAEEAIRQGRVVGEVLAEKFGFDSKATWITCFSPHRKTRVDQLEEAGLQCFQNLFGEVVMASIGGR